MQPPNPRALAAFVIPCLVGGACGQWLLARTNDADPDVLAALRRAADPDGPAPTTPPRRVVVVLLDGVGEAPFAAAERDGTLGPVAWSQAFDTGAPSLSAPGYHVLLTGVAQDVSGVRNNGHTRGARADTVADRVRAAGGSVAWALESVDWMYGLAGSPRDARVNGARATDVDALADLAARHTLTVVHWTATDHAGHDHGGASAYYADVARAHLARARRLRERVGRGVALFVGADHGHSARGGHGGPEAEVRHIRWVRLGGDATPSDPRRLPATAMAATLTDALGVAPPRETTACAARATPWPGASAARCASIEARDALVTRALASARAQARGRSAATLAAFAVAVATLARRSPRARAALAAVAWLTLAASAGYAVAGTGWTLTAIRTQAAFLARTVAAMSAGAALAWPHVRRATRARHADVAWATALVPLAALACVAGSTGRALVGDVAWLAAPSAGLVPSAVCAALAGHALARRARKRAFAVDEAVGAGFPSRAP